MLQFTKEVDYSIRLLLALSKLKKEKFLSLHNFSEESKISFLFLQRIAKKLREAGLIKSIKGAQGGYRLNVDFKKITVKNLIEALEGEFAVVNCLKKGSECSRASGCSSQKVFVEINKKFVNYLKNLRLSEII